jgi:hypothetical protein
MPDKSSTELLLSAVRKAVEPLAALPETTEARLLREMAADFEAAILAWTPRSPPDADDREIMMKRVLALTIAVAKHVRCNAAQKR